MQRNLNTQTFYIGVENADSRIPPLHNELKYFSFFVLGLVLGLCILATSGLYGMLGFMVFKLLDTQVAKPGDLDDPMITELDPVALANPCTN